MENQDFLQIGAVNSSLPMSGQQQGNLFSSDLLQFSDTKLNQPGSFSNQIEAGIADFKIKTVEYDQYLHESGLGSTSQLAVPTTNSESPTSLDNSDALIGNVPLVNSEAVLDLAVATAKEQLESFVSDEEFVDKMNLAFGENWQPQTADALIQDLASSEAIPKIEILPAANLKANGAFGEDTIYLSEEFLAENAANPEAVAGVLLEEIGHYVDQELGNVDSPGDEGDIFARLVQGETIAGAELTALKAEDDSATIALNGQEFVVELADPPYPGYLLQYEPGESLTYDENVQQWQQRMKDRGWDIDVDGLYGPASESIARQFQQAKDLAVDGIVGPETWEASFDTSTPPFPGNLFKYESGETLTYDANVEQWQQRMSDLGKTIDVDGLYGPQSAQVARDFQAEQGLSVDGIVGPQTWEASFDTETPPPEESPPPPVEPPQPEPTSSFQENVVAIARQEWEDFDQGALKEDEPEAVQQIEEYFQSFGGEYTDQAWSAAFISWVMGEAGAGEAFNYSQLHADYINQAIADRESGAAFIGYDIDEYSPQVGDLIGRNRPDNNGSGGSDVIVTYDDAVDTGGYSSHVDIVVATRPGEIDVIGGNVSDSVTLETYTIDSEGKIINDNDAVDDDWFVVIENRFGEDPAPPVVTPPVEPTDINQAGLDLVQEFEGYAEQLGDGTDRVRAYSDPGGVLTIGFGHTGPDVEEGMIITREQAEQLLIEDLGEAETAVSNQVTVPLNENQFSALVSFVFNVGSGNFEESTLLELLNQSDYQGAADQFLDWNKADGEELEGLTRRREEERELFLTPVALA